jgi:hypothetical protein
VRLREGFAATRSWVGLAAANVAAGAALAGAGPVLGVALGVWAADTAWRAARLVAPGRVRAAIGAEGP